MKKIKNKLNSFIAIVIKNESISLLVFLIVVIAFLGWQIDISLHRLLREPRKEIAAPIIEDPQLRSFPQNKEWGAEVDEIQREIMEKMKEQPLFKLLELFKDRIQGDLAYYIEENPELKAKFQEIDQKYGKRFQELLQRVADQEIGIEEAIEQKNQIFEDWYRALEDFVELVEQKKAEEFNNQIN